MTSEHASEHLEDCWLDPDDVDALLREQNECTFTWVNHAGQPFGVIMSFFHVPAPSPAKGLGTFWLTCAAHRARVRAIRRTGYAALTVTSKGTSLGTGKTASYRGPCTVHDDRAVLDWMLPELARVLRPDSPEGANAMLQHLDTPNRVVLELTPEVRLDFDSSKMWTKRPEAAPPGRL
jgi:general stress protein 26